MCRILYSTPIDRTRDVCRILYSTPIDKTRDVCRILYSTPIDRTRDVCRILYSTPIDRTRDESLARFPFKDDLGNSRGLHSVSAYRHGLYIYRSRPAGVAQRRHLLLGIQ